MEPNKQNTQPVVSAQQHTILIVEDDPILIKMYKTKFEAEGLKVVTANDGETGLKLIKTMSPSLVILDIMMPVLSGIDLLKKYKADLGVIKIPIIVLSNLSSEDDMKKAFELGVKEYLVKANYTPKDVFDHAKKYLG